MIDVCSNSKISFEFCLCVCQIDQLIRNRFDCYYTQYFCFVYILNDQQILDYVFDSFVQFFCRWVVLFSHPSDFTPVCTTELGRMAVHKEHFCKRNVKLLAHSVDDLQSHVDWVNVGVFRNMFILLFFFKFNY